MMQIIVSKFTLPLVIRKMIHGGSEIIRNSLRSLVWGPALAVAKPAVLSIFRRVETGMLLIIDEPTKTRYVFGQKSSDKFVGVLEETGLRRRPDSIPRVTMVVKNDTFWMRVFLFADMGFSESYMLGDVECTDLTSFFQLFIVNRDKVANGTTWLSKALSTFLNLVRSTNTLSNALLNASAHYDISNDMFAAFLSPDMTYSCPVWGRHSKEEQSLEEAQMTKLRLFISNARIQSTDHVLEIGTGWGSFAIEAVKSTGCRVTSLTLSQEQKVLADKKIGAMGLADKIEVKLLDYRALPAPEVPFDKIVSIEMLEAVGQEYLATYFNCINRQLKKQGGIAVFQCITMPEARHETYSNSKDFINHYIFPGGYLPSTTQLLNHISKQSQGTLIIENVENIGGHYARALRLWKENFLCRFEEIIRPALLNKHPELTNEGIEVFRKKWEYYFSYCEAGFMTKTLGDVIITVGRERATELMDGIPL